MYGASEGTLPCEMGASYGKHVSWTPDDAHLAYSRDELFHHRMSEDGVKGYFQSSGQLLSREGAPGERCDGH